MLLVLSYLTSTCLFFILRLWPNWYERHQGCDAYYFLLNIEIFKKEKKLPITLPHYYLMEYAEQSYPPGFSVFCSLFPETFLKKYYWALNHIIDFITASIGFGVTFWLTGNVFLSAATIVLYAMNNVALSELRTLTSRSLSVLLITIFILCGFLATTLNILFILPAFLIGAILIFTHKLAMQFLWFFIPIISIATGEWLWALSLALSYISAALIHWDLFYKIQRHHWDMILFWTKYWPGLGAHHIQDSHLYGNGQKPSLMYDDKNIYGWIKYAKHLLKQSHYIFIPLLFLLSAEVINASIEFLLIWQISGIIAAISIICIPILRGIGNGWQYTKYIALPSIIAAIALLNLENWTIAQYLCLCLIAMSSVIYIKAALTISKNSSPNSERFNSEFDTLVEEIKSMPDDINLLCLPLHLCDAIVYKARKNVLWGSHSYPFRPLENFFPILKKPLSEYIKSYNLTHAVIDTAYIPSNQIGLQGKPEFTSGQYAVYSLEGFKDPVKKANT